jgi:hypothetical protein
MELLPEIAAQEEGAASENAACCGAGVRRSFAEVKNSRRRKWIALH